MTRDANYTAEDARSDSYRRPAHEDCRSDVGCPGCDWEAAQDGEDDVIYPAGGGSGGEGTDDGFATVSGRAGGK